MIFLLSLLLTQSFSLLRNYCNDLNTHHLYHPYHPYHACHACHAYQPFLNYNHDSIHHCFDSIVHDFAKHACLYPVNLLMFIVFRTVQCFPFQMYVKSTYSNLTTTSTSTLRLTFVS